MSKKDYPYLAYSEFTGHVYVILSKNKKVDVTNQYKFITREKDGIDKLNADLKNAYAEIKKLKEENAKLQKTNNLESVKNFWSVLKSHARKMHDSDWSGEFWNRAVLVETGDNILREMEKKPNDSNNLEAIKDFWSKLKTHKRKMQGSDWSGDFWDAAILVSVGDDLVREMEKENNG